MARNAADAAGSARRRVKNFHEMTGQSCTFGCGLQAAWRMRVGPWTAKPGNHDA
jgi:hypothetical protein